MVPFSAIKSFLDPSVQFGLQFDTGEAAAPASDRNAPRDGDRAGAAAAARPRTTADGDKKPAEGAEVVRLDRFRKK